ncbi:zinc chelation protein SecC [Enemella evansiae]|nr:zinc chelation protein SecC [Enemella evansiae]
MPTTGPVSESCPCGSSRGYADCCGPLHDGARQAATAEELMRARYSAFVRGRPDFLFRSWHPRTRPAEVDTAPLDWLGLEILATEAGGAGDDTGMVEFVARYREPGARTPSALHERSRFARRAGRWLYLDGDASTTLIE